MNPHAQPAPMEANTPRPKNLRTHYHVSLELQAGERRVRCLSLRMEGLTIRQIATELGISATCVQTHIQHALAASRAQAASLGAELREKERVRLQAIIDRWQPVATGPYRTKKAAKAAEIVAKASEALRKLYGVEPSPQFVEQAASPSPSEESERCVGPADAVMYRAFDDIVLTMARAKLIPGKNFDQAWDTVEEAWPGKYQPASIEVENFLRKEWNQFVAIPFASESGC